MPSVSSPANLHIASFIRLAAGDLNDAKLLRANKSRNAAYLVEQAAEKIILALLISENVSVAVRESHRLDILVDKIPHLNPLLERLKSITFLTIFATTYRYPKTAGRIPKDPDWMKIDSAIQSVDGLVLDLSDHFGVNLEDGDSVPSTNICPFRGEEDGSGGGMSGGPK